MANKITVTSAGTIVNANVTPDTAMYYSNKSKDWAISDKIVDNTDYSSKYYANESKKQADISTAKTTEVIESGNNAVSNIESARDNAIIDITNQENLSVDNVNTAGITQVANVNSAGTTQINLAKEQVALATNQANIATEQATIATNKTSEVIESGNTALSNIDTAKNNAITSITNQETTSKTVLIDEGATQIGLIQNEGVTQVANVQSTGFYMRDDKLYFINSQGEETEFKSGGSGLEICDIGMALYVDETKGLRRYLNGQIVDINTNTQVFLDRLLQIKTTNPDYFTDEETWQTEATLNVDGCVYKFVLNYASDGETVVSVRLPKYPDYVEINAGGTLPVVGNGTTLGLTDGVTNAGWTVYNAQANSYVWNANGYGTSVGTTVTHAASFTDAKTIGVTTDPTKSGIEATLKQTKLKMRYFIQIATGSETENNIINEIELNNPYSLFDSKYSDHELNNLSWLKSEGQWNAKAVYPTAYNKLLKVYNGTETVEGLSVKLSTETYTDYDFVLNTADETFRLPLLDGSEDLPSQKFDNLTLTSSDSIYIAPANGRYYLKMNASTGQFINMHRINASGDDIIISHDVSVNNLDVFTEIEVRKGDKVRITHNTSGNVLAFKFIYAQGNGSLYFYVGETVQNANLIDAGRIGEQLATKTDMLQASGAGMPSDKYIDLTLGASGSTYTAPANGWVYFARSNINGYVALLTYINNDKNNIKISTGQAATGGVSQCYIPVRKGDEFTATYNGGEAYYFRFIYAEGSK